MTIELTAEQKEAFRDGRPVEWRDPETGQAGVLLRADEFHKIMEFMREEADDQKFQRAWQEAAMKGVARVINDESR